VLVVLYTCLLVLCTTVYVCMYVWFVLYMCTSGLIYLLVSMLVFVHACAHACVRACVCMCVSL